MNTIIFIRHTIVVFTVCLLSVFSFKGEVWYYKFFQILVFISVILTSVKYFLTVVPKNHIIYLKLRNSAANCLLYIKWFDCILLFGITYTFFILFKKRKVVFFNFLYIRTLY